MYTAKEASDLLRVHISTLLRMIHRGAIKAVKVGRAYRISEEEIQRIKEKGVKQ